MRSFVSLLCALLLQTPPPPQRPMATPAPIVPPVLVLPFTVDAAPGTSGLAGAPFWFGEAAAIALTDELAALGVPAATRDERVGVFESLQLPINAALSRATVIRTGEVIGASAIVLGDVRLADKVTVRARVIDLATGRQFADVTVDGGSPEFFALMARVAKGLDPHLAKGGPIVPVPSRPSIEAFEDYVKGLVATGPDAQVKFLEAALVHAPNDPRTLIALSHARTVQGDHAKALEAANKVPATSRDARVARFLAAQSLMALKRFDDAFKALDQLYKEAPLPAVSNALGVLQLRRGGVSPLGSPAFFFNRAVEESRGDVEIAFNLGYAYALAGDATSAIYWLREVVRRQPADGTAHLVLSALLAGQGKTVEAQREFDLSKLLGASESETATLTAVVPKGLERLETELHHALVSHTAPADAEIEQKDQTATFYLDRGRRFMDETRDKEAIDEFRRAIYVSPYLDQPHLLLGRVLQRTGRLSEAVSEFTLALWCLETADAHASLASAQLAMGKPDQARASATRALALDPANALAKDVIRQLGGLVLLP